jgi:branched-chain amino acid transport system permease protein
MFSEVYEFAGLMFPALVLWTPLLTLAILGVVLFIIYRTKAGRAMRCISHDMETTRLMGVDVNRVISVTFAVGSAAAAAGGIMWAMRYPEINPLMGIIPGFKAFVAAVLGGIGNITGAMLGGLLLGIAEILLVAVMPELAGYRDAVAFGLLILILLFRPTGLMGTKLPD